MTLSKSKKSIQTFWLKTQIIIFTNYSRTESPKKHSLVVEIWLQKREFKKILTLWKKNTTFLHEKGAFLHDRYGYCTVLQPWLQAWMTWLSTSRNPNQEIQQWRINQKISRNELWWRNKMIQDQIFTWGLEMIIPMR